MRDAGSGSSGRIPEHFYRRDLPHWQPVARSIFITTRLYGSIPAVELRRMEAELEFLERELVSRSLPQDQRALELARRRFAHYEAALDRALNSTTTARWLEQPEVARIVRDAFYFWDGERYDLQRYTIMPNHVHLLIYPLPLPETAVQSGKPDPRWPLARIMKGLKGFTARAANKVLGRSGHFWEDENFDHWVRDDAEAERIRLYIDRNPVKAGLCNEPHEWPWSSAHDEKTK